MQNYSITNAYNKRHRGVILKELAHLYSNEYIWQFKALRIQKSLKVDLCHLLQAICIGGQKGQKGSFHKYCKTSRNLFYCHLLFIVKSYNKEPFVTISNNCGLQTFPAFLLGFRARLSSIFWKECLNLDLNTTNTSSNIACF